REGVLPGGGRIKARTKGQFHRRHRGVIGDRLLLVNQMSELQKEPSPPPHPADTLPPPPPPASTKSPTSLPSAPPNQPPLHRFDPSRMIGIIKRKALIKDLAAVYHAECLAYCQELLELQKKCEEVADPVRNSYRVLQQPCLWICSQFDHLYIQTTSIQVCFVCSMVYPS
ncbi:hypothetical protein Ccrd_000491, partial [Cynara cardunculus var. scolymus]